jgi:hypothetical protein
MTLSRQHRLGLTGRLGAAAPDACERHNRAGQSLTFSSTPHMGRIIEVRPFFLPQPGHHPPRPPHGPRTGGMRTATHSKAIAAGPDMRRAATALALY